MVCVQPFIKSAIKLYALNSKGTLKPEVGRGETFQILQQTPAYYIPDQLLSYNSKTTDPQNKKKTNKQKALLKFLHR